MNIFTTHFIRRAARLAGVLSAWLCLLAGALAQPPENRQPGRFLFVFETTSAVKKTLPALDKCLAAILADGLQGELRAGDEIGVWTLDEKVHTGQFPLTTWWPTNAAGFERDLKAFLASQSYSTKGSLATLAPLLNSVVENSERLTVLIFCDGQTTVAGTPFDENIRVIFDTSASAQKKLRQPVLLALRSQQGKYTGSSVTLPPNALSLPEFPPLPAKPAPVVAPVIKPAPAVKPPPVVPSLIMVGTNVSTNPAPVTAVAKPVPVAPKPVPAPIPVATAEPVVAEPAIKPPPATEPAPLPPPTPAPEKPAPPANIVVISPKPAPPATPPVKMVAPTNPPTVVAAPAANDNGKPLLYSIVGAAAGMALVLGIVLAFRARRPTDSLITSSMTQPLPPPPPRPK